MGNKILVVDDEAVLLETIVYNLELAGYQVSTAADGASALETAHREKPDLMILDLMLPVIDGLEVCRQLRREDDTAGMLILMLTAKSDEIDTVVGLEVGADDYVTKPFSKHELLARVRALLRRQGRITQSDKSDEEQQTPRRAARTLVCGPIEMNLDGRRVYRSGQEIDLQPKQYELLKCLMQNRGTVLTRDQLLQNVWGYDYAGDTRTVDVHVRWLREKLEEDPANPKLIQTVRGVGYCLRV
jgi:DNA-binding response OmpR family regulator